jgi:hypothetical protein
MYSLKVLFTIKLDNVFKVSTITTSLSYFSVSIPFYFACLLLIFLCFNSRSGNLCNLDFIFKEIFFILKFVFKGGLV